MKLFFFFFIELHIRIMTHNPDIMNEDVTLISIWWYAVITDTSLVLESKAVLGFKVEFLFICCQCKLLVLQLHGGPGWGAGPPQKNRPKS